MLQKKCRRVKKTTTKQERERFCLVLQISADKESLAQSQKKKWCQLNIKYSHGCVLINGKFLSASISGKAYQCLLRYLPPMNCHRDLQTEALVQLKYGIAGGLFWMLPC